MRNQPVPVVEIDPANRPKQSEASKFLPVLFPHLLHVGVSCV